MRLTIDSVEESGNAQSTERLFQYQKHSVKFCLENGRLVFAEFSPEEDISSVSLKKSILFQLQMSGETYGLPFRTIEIDHLGTCQTEYIPKNITSQSVTFVKKRNSITCRDDVQIYPLASNLLTSEQKLTVNDRSLYLDSDLTCELTYQPKGHLNIVHCHEVSVIKPWIEAFYTKPVAFSVYLVIDLIDVNIYKEALPVFHGVSSKYFEFPEEKNRTVDTDHSYLEEIIKNQSFINMVLNSPEKFSDFFEQLQHLTYEQLVEVYSAWNQFGQPNKYLEFLKNIIAELRTDASMKFIIKHLIMNKMDKCEQLEWIRLLGVVQAPSYQLIKEMKNLLDSALYEDTVHVVSLNIRKFCESNPSCMEFDVIRNMIAVIEDSVKSKDIDKSLISLEAISNIGLFLPSKKAISVVRNILVNRHDADNYNLRIYTGQIISQFECDESLNTLLWSIILNENETSELRIIVFNAYFQCLDHLKMRNILSYLSRSLHNQVRSYIVSKIFSLLRTKDTNKQHLQSIVYKFQEEIRRFNEEIGIPFTMKNSFYYEFLQKTKFGNFLTEFALIYESNFMLPTAFSVHLQRQTSGKTQEIISVYYRFGRETMVYKTVTKFLNFITSFIPSVKEYLEGVEKQLPAKYDAIFIKWLDETVFNSLNISNDFSRLFLSDQHCPDKPLKLSHAKTLQQSHFSFPLISGIYIKSRIVAISYINSYVKGKYMLNPYLFSAVIKHNSKLYITQSMQLVSGFHEHFGFRSDRQIGFNLQLNESIKLSKLHNYLMFELFSGAWPDNYELFKYTRTDYLSQHSQVNALESKNSKLSNSDSLTEKKSKPFGGFHINTQILYDAANPHSLMQVVQIKFCEMKGLFIHFVYNMTNISTSKEENSVVDLLITRPSFTSQQDPETANKFIETNLQLNQQNNKLQFLHAKVSSPWGNSYQLYINVSDDGLIRGEGYVNQNKILQTNGTAKIDGINMETVTQIYHPSGIINMNFNRTSNLFVRMKVTNQDDSFPFELNLMNNIFKNKNLEALGIAAFNTSVSVSLSSLLNVRWKFQLNSPQDQWPPVYHCETIFNATVLQRYLSYQSSFFWNEGPYENEKSSADSESDKHITLKMKAESSTFPSGLECLINIFKTKEFLTPISGKPSKFHIQADFIYANSDRYDKMNVSFLSLYEINTERIKNLTSLFAFSIPNKEINFLFNHKMDWKFSCTGALVKFHTMLDMHSHPVNESVKVTLLHNSEEQLLSSLLMEYNDAHHRKVYSIKSWLQPWRSLHEFILQWPNLHTIRVLSIYDITTVDSYAGLTLDHLVYFNHDKHLQVKNQLMYKLNEHKFTAFHQTETLNTTNNYSHLGHNITVYTNKVENKNIISKLELTLQLLPELHFLPLHIKFICEGKIHLYAPNFKIDEEGQGKLKVDFTKMKGETLLKLTDRDSNNQTKFNTELELNYEFNHKSLINANFDLITQSGKQNSVTLNWKSSDNNNFIALNCLSSSLGNLIYHSKHRWDSVYHFDGSNMISIQTNSPNYLHRGFYLSNNYALNLDSNQKLFEIRAEYSTTNAKGPGSPVRARIFFKHGEKYEHGNLEVGLDSQLLGYYFGYEMINGMVQYEFNSPKTENEVVLTSRGIVGYRLHEGRGTRGYQGELLLNHNKEDAKLDILCRVGRPGLMDDNKIEYSHTLQKMHTYFHISTVFLRELYFQGHCNLRYIDELLIPIKSNITLLIPWLPLLFSLNEQLERTKAIFKINENLVISTTQALNQYRLNQSFLFEKSGNSSNIYDEIQFQWNTNIFTIHRVKIAYKRLQFSEEINEHLLADWNSSVYSLVMYNSANDEINVHYNITDKLWNTVSYGNFSLLTKSKQEYSVKTCHLSGILVIPYYDISYSIRNFSFQSKQQVDNVESLHFFEVCNNCQTLADCYANVGTLKLFTNPSLYELYSKISHEHLGYLNVYFQFKELKDVDFQITVNPVNFKNYKVIKVSLNNYISPEDCSLSFNGSVEIQPFLPRMSALLKLSSDAPDLSGNSANCPTYFKLSLQLINANSNSKWRNISLFYDRSIDRSDLSIQVEAPDLTLPYTMVSSSERKLNISSKQMVDSFNIVDVENISEPVKCKITLLQTKRKSSISLDIMNTYLMLIEMHNHENNSYNSMNMSLFSRVKRLGLLFQAAETIKLSQQLSYKLFNYIEIGQYNFNLSFNLAHLIKQNNSLVLLKVNFTSNFPLLCDYQINEIYASFENQQGNSNFLIMFDLYFKETKVINHKFEVVASTVIPILVAEMHINKILGFTENQNWLVEVKNNDQKIYFLVFLNNNQIIMIDYAFEKFTLIVIIEQMIHLTTNLLGFISNLLKFIDVYSDKRKDNENQTAIQLPCVNEECFLYIVTEGQYPVNLVVKFHLHSEVKIMQIQRILSKNFTLSSSLYFIPSVHCSFLAEQNISPKQSAFSLNYHGYIENVFNDTFIQINFTSDSDYRGDRNMKTTMYFQINRSNADTSNADLKLPFITSLCGQYILEFHIFVKKDKFENITFHSYINHELIGQDQTKYLLYTKTKHRLFNLTIINDSFRRHVTVLFDPNLSIDDNAVSVDYLSEGRKKSVHIKTAYRQILCSFEDRQSMDDSYMYRNKTVTWKYLNLLENEVPRNVETELTIYQKNSTSVAQNEERLTEGKSQQAGIQIKSNILKQGFINIMSEILKDRNKFQLSVNMNHGENLTDENIDHQLIVTWPYTLEKMNYPLLFIKSMDKFLSIKGGYVQQSGIINTSAQIRTNDEKVNWELSWEKCSFRILIDKYAEFAYKHIHNCNNDSNNTANNNIYQVSCQLLSQNDFLNFSNTISTNYPSNEENMDMGYLFIGKTILDCNKQRTVMQAQITSDYNTMLETNSVEKSKNEGHLNVRFMTNLDHLNNFHLFSYWRPELIEDILTCQSELPKYFNPMDEYSLFRTFHHTKNLLIHLMDAVIYSVDEIKLRQLTNTLLFDAESFSQELKKWIDNDYFYLQTLNATVFKNIAQINFSVTESKLWQTLQILFNNMTSSQLSILKDLENNYKQFWLSVRRNLRRTLKMPFVGIDLHLDYLINLFQNKSQELFNDAAKGFELGRNCFDTLWYNVTKISKMWLELPEALFVNILDTNDFDANTAEKLKNITIHITQMNEYLKNILEEMNKLFRCNGMNNGTREFCDHNRSNKSLCMDDFTYEQLHQFIHLIRNEQTEESFTSLLFEQNSKNFTKYKEKNWHYFKVYIPQSAQIFIRYLPQLWSHYIQHFEEQSRMKPMASYVTTKTNNSG
ncbi:unnamed protein product [Trichobilharzia szidati]|nr:unnamed protein product [Trichobilharzia szidati]